MHSKLVVFDIDGTLLDNLATEDECFSRALCDGLDLRSLDTNWATYEHVSDHGITFEAHQRAFGCAPTAEQLTRTIARFVEMLAAAHALTPMTTIAGAADILIRLAERGWAVALATGAWRHAAEFKLAAGGVSSGAIPLATSEDGPARVDIVRAAVARAQRAHGVEAFERVVSVGDGMWDIHAARTLDLAFVGRASHDRAAGLIAAGASHTLADFTDVERMVNALEMARVP